MSSPVAVGVSQQHQTTPPQQHLAADPTMTPQYIKTKLIQCIRLLRQTNKHNTTPNNTDDDEDNAQKRMMASKNNVQAILRYLNLYAKITFQSYTSTPLDMIITQSDGEEGEHNHSPILPTRPNAFCLVKTTPDDDRRPGEMHYHQLLAGESMGYYEKEIKTPRHHALYQGAWTSPVFGYKSIYIAATADQLEIGLFSPLHHHNPPPSDNPTKKPKWDPRIHMVCFDNYVAEQVDVILSYIEALVGIMAHSFLTTTSNSTNLVIQQHYHHHQKVDNPKPKTTSAFVMGLRLPRSFNIVQRRTFFWQALQDNVNTYQTELLSRLELLTLPYLDVKAGTNNEETCGNQRGRGDGDDDALQNITMQHTLEMNLNITKEQSPEKEEEQQQDKEEEPEKEEEGEEQQQGQQKEKDFAPDSVVLCPPHVIKATLCPHQITKGTFVTGSKRPISMESGLPVPVTYSFVSLYSKLSQEHRIPHLERIVLIGPLLSYVGGASDDTRIFDSSPMSLRKFQTRDGPTFSPTTEALLSSQSLYFTLVSQDFDDNNFFTTLHGEYIYTMNTQKYYRANCKYLTKQQFLQAALCVERLREAGYEHCDIRLPNFVMKDGEVKLVGFKYCRPSEIKDSEQSYQHRTINRSLKTAHQFETFLQRYKNDYMRSSGTVYDNLSDLLQTKRHQIDQLLEQPRDESYDRDALLQLLADEPNLDRKLRQEMSSDLFNLVAAWFPIVLEEMETIPETSILSAVCLLFDRGYFPPITDYSQAETTFGPIYDAFHELQTQHQ